MVDWTVGENDNKKTKANGFLFYPLFNLEILTPRFVSCFCFFLLKECAFVSLARPCRLLGLRFSKREPIGVSLLAFVLSR